MNNMKKSEFLFVFAIMHRSLDDVYDIRELCHDLASKFDRLFQKEYPNRVCEQVPMQESLKDEHMYHHTEVFEQRFPMILLSCIYCEKKNESMI